nr:MAG TPA: hypothetical protein [Bacteriophage sp.]
MDFHQSIFIYPPRYINYAIFTLFILAIRVA